MFMSTEGRKLINLLNEEARKQDVQGFTVSAHLYMSDWIATHYYMAPVLGVIQARMKTYKKDNGKYYTVDYWLPIIEQTLKNQPGTHRDMASDDVNVPNKLGMNDTKYELLTDYIGHDYGLTEAHAVLLITNMASYSELVDAVREAKRYGAYSAQYVLTILTGIWSRREVGAKMRQQLAEQSVSKLDGQIIIHTPLELAQAEYNLQQARENMKLELMLNEMLGGIYNE